MNAQPWMEHHPPQKSSRKPHNHHAAGQALAEYALLLGFVALVALAALTSYGRELTRALERINFDDNGEEIDRSLMVEIIDFYDAYVSGVQVFAYTDAGDYVGLVEHTNREGFALFQPEDGAYQFLAYFQGQWVWSDIVTWPQQDYVEIEIQRDIFQVRVIDISGNPAYGIPVSVFSESGDYIGLQETTRRNGMSAFYLASGNVQFRADADGTEYWSNIVASDSGEVTITINSCGVNYYLAEYFNNRNLSGAPVFTQCEQAINYDWGNGDPGNGISNNNFSVRWSGNIEIAEGTYRFTTNTDDGVRLWVDGSQLVDAWQNQPETSYSVIKDVESGLHAITMEYFARNGNAVAQLSWVETITSCPDGQYLAEYYNNRNLSGDPTVTQCENSINYNWGSGAPIAGINNNQFSVRWIGTFVFNESTYGFNTTADDGVRFWLDDQLLVDEWHNQSATTYSINQAITAGSHTLKMEYYENYGNTAAILNWQEVVTSCEKGEFLAEYFNNRTMSGTPTFTRCENRIRNDWGSDGPGNGINSDNFSVKWKGTFDLTADPYTFSATGDDGFQVYIDNILLINQWHDQAATTYTATHTPSAGEHTITMYYYERYGHAVAQLRWWYDIPNEVP
ncbi:MAG: hypothetical protein GY943_27635 [Chloroflexi bacterium]|nr:hypothetical protein [Chloroflexota bacterium]